MRHGERGSRKLGPPSCHHNMRNITCCLTVQHMPLQPPSASCHKQCANHAPTAALSTAGSPSHRTHLHALPAAQGCSPRCLPPCCVFAAPAAFSTPVGIVALHWGTMAGLMHGWVCPAARGGGQQQAVGTGRAVAGCAARPPGNAGGSRATRSILKTHKEAFGRAGAPPAGLPAPQKRGVGCGGAAALCTRCGGDGGSPGRGLALHAVARGPPVNDPRTALIKMTRLAP